MNRLKIFVVVSVAVNLFALGAVSSFFLTRPPGPPRGGFGPMDPIRGPLVSPRELDQLLSPEGAKARDAVLKAERHLIHEDIQHLLAARRAVLEEARKTPLDMAAVGKALDEMRHWDSVLTEQAQKTMLSLLPQLPDEDRLKVVDAALERMDMMPPRPPPPLPGEGSRQ